MAYTKHMQRPVKTSGIISVKISPTCFLELNGPMMNSEMTFQGSSEISARMISAIR